MSYRMMRNMMTLAGALLLMPAAGLAVQATLTDDAYTTVGSGNNYGTKTTLKLEIGESDGWVKFDVSTLGPVNDPTEVVQAILKVYVQKVSTAGTMDVYRGGGFWTEASLTDPGPGLGTIVDSGIAVDSRYDYVTVNVTAAVQEWIFGTNFGLVLVPTGGLEATFDSKESKSTSQEPVLEVVLRPTVRSADIDYTMPPGEPTNTVLGASALSATNTGFRNTAAGWYALSSNTAGTFNVAVGAAALENIVSGDSNIAIGESAGQNLGGAASNNIMIGSPGSFSDSNTIRIGEASHNLTFIEGIHGSTSASGIAVLVNSSGRLGTTTSSRRVKTDIRGIGDTTSTKLLRLRPVSFRYKPEVDPEGVPQYGLIAEEVAEVFPELVVNNDDGTAYSVRYHLLTALLLSELQRQHRTQETLLVEIEQQRHHLDRQLLHLTEISGANRDLRAQNAALVERLDRIEHTVRAVTGPQPAAGAVPCETTQRTDKAPALSKSDS